MFSTAHHVIETKAADGNRYQLLFHFGGICPGNCHMKLFMNYGI